MKLTNKQINQISKLYMEGMKLREISRKLKINVSTVRYHSKEETKKKMIKISSNSFSKKPIEERRKIYKRRLPYLREYQRRRYNEDEEFRKKNQERARNYHRKHSKPIEDMKGGKKHEI